MGLYPDQKTMRAFVPCRIERSAKYQNMVRAMSTLIGKPPETNKKEGDYIT